MEILGSTCQQNIDYYENLLEKNNLRPGIGVMFIRREQEALTYPNLESFPQLQYLQLLVSTRHDPNGVMTDKWQMPGGKLYKGEDVYMGLFREVREEISLPGDAIDFFDHFLRNVYISNIFSKNGHTRRLSMLVMATMPYDIAYYQTNEPTKSSNWGWYDLGAMIDLSINEPDEVFRPVRKALTHMDLIENLVAYVNHLGI